MRTEFRTKPPYYGKYNYKLELDLSNGPYSPVKSLHPKGEKKLFSEILRFLDSNIGSEHYKTMHSWGAWKPIYITREDKLNDFLGSEYGKYATYLYKPAPGFEDSKLAVSKPGKDALWYGRYPYKVILWIINVDPELNDAVGWCHENCFGSYRKSGYTRNVSFFFINPIDAVGFKLRFSDESLKTQMPEKKIAEKLLRDRIKEAEKDLEDFLEGDTQ